MAEQGLNDRLNMALLGWYDAHARVLPWREAKADPYRVWLSEIMLQQTTVAAVKDYFLRFVAKWPRVEDLAAAHLDDVLKAWAGLGYYARARNLHACAKVVAGAFGGKFPNDMAGLQALPGIGPYTAAAIAAIAFDFPAAAVDGNVERVVSRFYAIEEALPQSKPRIRALAQALVPRKRAGDFAQAMMDLGATICTPKSPACQDCPWADECVGRAKGIAAQLPRKAAKAKIPTRHAHIYWVTDGNRAVLVRQRAMKGLLAGMTEFPSSDWIEGKAKFAPPFDAAWKRLRGVVEHTFTHFNFEMTIWATQTETPALGGRFVHVDALEGEALPSVMRKVAAHALKAK